jgi:hypothetical protein
MGAMNHANGMQRTVILELLAIGDGLSGRAFAKDGAPCEFSGRIGLMRAIDELVDAGSSEDHRPGHDRTEGRKSAPRLQTKRD